MCGIAGIVANTDGLGAIHSMTSALKHRGPDSEGFFHSPGVALGHRRLAILDFSSAGSQPMRSRDGRFTIALNGEIFNYCELRRELAGPFASATDTEALVEACAAWGIERALPRLNGMFAFALWNQHESELTLARDRSGEKPLVYFWDGITFAFASEIKALAGLHSSRLEPAAVDAYLALGYIPAPLAIFRNCHKLPAGHLLRFHCGKIEIRRWWFPERVSGRAAGSGNREPALRCLVSSAVRLRLRSDAPVALSLSGGVDSSVIAAECAAQDSRTDAFTAVLDGDETDLPYARLAARHLGLRHHVIRVSSQAVSRQFDLAAEHYDEPFADSSALPSLALAQALAGQYKVILNGDGGDEAFGGYSHYAYVTAKQFLKIAAAAAGLRDGNTATGVYVQSKAIFRERERTRLLCEHAPGGTLPELLDRDAYLRHASGTGLRKALWRDRHLYLPNDLTFKMDIALAAFGMEGRAPFLDHRILEWAQNLPARDLVRGHQKKILLRRAYSACLPPALLNRPKHGFGSPIKAWLDGPLKTTVAEFLPCPLLDPELQLPARGQKLWTLLTFARWARTWRARW